MANAVGPCFVGGFEEFVVRGDDRNYTILFLPDRENEQLQAEGKSPVYYWVPGEVRLARRGDSGDFMFNHTHFVGVLSDETTIGATGDSEVAGGVLGFTTTSRYPTDILKAATDQLLERFRGTDDRYWGWRSSAAPAFRIAPIQSNTTAISSLSPGSNGLAPVEEAVNRWVDEDRRNRGAGSARPPSGGAMPPGPPPGSRMTASVPRLAVHPLDPSRRVVHGRSETGRSPNLDAWAFEAQGQGAGSVTGGNNAYSVLMGAHPSEIIWEGFHGSYSPVVVAQNLVMPMWSEEILLYIKVDWRGVHNHLSTAVSAGGRFWNADVAAEFESSRLGGNVEVEISIDGTRPGADKMEEAIQERSQVILTQFMDLAQKEIFEPARPDREPATASRPGGVFGRIFGGGAVSLKAAREVTEVVLEFEEKRNFRYLQSNTISSSLDGIFQEMKRDPDAEKKYFNLVRLGGLGRKVHRIVKPVVRWRKPDNEYIGDPVAFMSAQVGYPLEDGSMQWRPSVFQRTDSDEEASDVADFVRLDRDEVENPPADWDPDKTFVKRTIHFEESMGSTDDPYVKVFVEQNDVDLDPGPNGTLTNDSVIEVRADNAGKLEVAIVGIDAFLENDRQVVEVEIKPSGIRADGSERGSVSFVYKHDDQDKQRILEIFTGQPDYVPAYELRVHVKVLGTLFNRGMSWTGPWVPGNANGSIMVHVPLADEDGVTNVVRYTPRDLPDLDRAMNVPSTPATPGTNGPGPSVTPRPGGTRPELPTEPQYTIAPPPGVN